VVIGNEQLQQTRIWDRKMEVEVIGMSDELEIWRCPLWNSRPLSVIMLGPQRNQRGMAV
jgi:hypothetical protein